MTFQPIVPTGGNLGWSFLSRTRTDQQDAFDNSSVVSRDTDYFRENIANISTAEELVADHRLLKVALGAFGLDDDIGNRYFIQKVLEEGTIDTGSFANRLADKRYFAMSEAFGFDLSPPKTVISDFSDSILSDYRNLQFEIAVGELDSDLRLALGVEREIADLAERDLSDESAWFTIMGNPPMRRVFEMALGLPSEIAAIDIDRQLEEFREKSQDVFGVSKPSEFSNPELQTKLIQNFLFRSQLSTSFSSTSQSSIALTLLQSQTPLF